MCNVTLSLYLIWYISHFPFFILIFYRDTAEIFNEGGCGVCVCVCVCVGGGGGGGGGAS